MEASAAPKAKSKNNTVPFKKLWGSESEQKKILPIEHTWKREEGRKVCVWERERERDSLFYNSLFLSVLLFWYQFSFSLFLLFSMKQTLSFLFAFLFYSKSVSCFLNSLFSLFVIFSFLFYSNSSFVTVSSLFPLFSLISITIILPFSYSFTHSLSFLFCIQNVINITKYLLWSISRLPFDFTFSLFLSLIFVFLSALLFFAFYN